MLLTRRGSSSSYRRQLPMSHASKSVAGQLPPVRHAGAFPPAARDPISAESQRRKRKRAVKTRATFVYIPFLRKRVAQHLLPRFVDLTDISTIDLLSYGGVQFMCFERVFIARAPNITHYYFGIVLPTLAHSHIAARAMSSGGISPASRSFPPLPSPEPRALLITAYAPPANQYCAHTLSSRLSGPPQYPHMYATNICFPANVFADRSAHARLKYSADPPNLTHGKQLIHGSGLWKFIFDRCLGSKTLGRLIPEHNCLNY
jgi:hypothetical protein